MLALFPVIVLTASPSPCFEARQLEENRCIDRLVETFEKEFGDPLADPHPGRDP